MHLTAASSCSAAARTRLFLSSITLPDAAMLDRKSTRLNSSHSQISYAVFCLKKKKKLGILALAIQSAGAQQPRYAAQRLDATHSTAHCTCKAMCASAPPARLP